MSIFLGAVGKGDGLYLSSYLNSFIDSLNENQLIKMYLELSQELSLYNTNNPLYKKNSQRHTMLKHESSYIESRLKFK